MWAREKVDCCLYSSTALTKFPHSECVVSMPPVIVVSGPEGDCLQLEKGTEVGQMEMIAQPLGRPVLASSPNGARGKTG